MQKQHLLEQLYEARAHKHWWVRVRVRVGVRVRVRVRFRVRVGVRASVRAVVRLPPPSSMTKTGVSGRPLGSVAMSRGVTLDASRAVDSKEEMPKAGT